MPLVYLFFLPSQVSCENLVAYTGASPSHMPNFLFPVGQVDTILDKENFTLEELLDEDEIIQECKALNTRLINL